jgi:hypothetical protein
MIVYEFTMMGVDKPINYLTPFQSIAESDSIEPIIIWEAEVAPIEFQYDDSEEKRKICKESGFSYCMDIGWVKLIKQIKN